MKITVLSSIKEAQPDSLLNRTVIVIDILRATTNIITALQYGSACVIPFETIEQTKAIYTHRDLLCGERECRKIAGFDLGNSPLEYRTSIIRGKRILLTTTNGTRVIRQARLANHILIGAFINAQACAKEAIKLNQDISLLCAGTNDLFSWEDGLCAGCIVNEMVNYSEARPDINDFGLCMQSSFLQVKDLLPQALLQCANGKKLRGLGFEEDIAYCAQMNLTELVPIFDQGVILSQRSKNVCHS
ncbi:MAG: 2-phosphosulfolactate phosphatase [Bacilli bacterium]|nr:2-phosphosulfolactate phosphatase [Bacilli bacterium]